MRKGYVVYMGDKDETNKFQFTVIMNNRFYNAVYKDEYMQIIENRANPMSKISDNTIEKICELVEKWFIENENNAWWLNKSK